MQSIIEPEKFLQEAIRIGEGLISISTKDKNGLSWKTMVLKGANSVEWGTSPYLYDGGSGIALFFLELYRKTRKKKYLSVVRDALRWIEWSYKKTNDYNYAFFTGRTGISYCYIKMHETTREKVYIDKALNNVKDINKYLDKSPVCDLINGVAGSLLGLLHIHAVTQTDWILSAINDQIEYILSHICHGQKGFYWDRSHQNIRGLCGFAHGSAGIGFTFLELGNYFHNNAYYWIADKAFSYEDYFYNFKLKNWPDFRKGIYDPIDYQEHVDAYKRGDLQFFSKEKYVNAWCHGASGIILSRLRAYEILEKKQFLKLITRSLNSEYIYKNQSFTLCHGLAGIAETYLQVGLLLNNNKYLPQAQEIASQIVMSKKNGNKYLSGYYYINNNKDEDYSLFNGNAGIGYFLLRVFDHSSSNSILNHSLNMSINKKFKCNNSLTNISLSNLKRKIIAFSFPKTISLGNTLFPKEISNLFFTRSDQKYSSIDSFIQTIQKIVKLKKSAKENYLEDIFLFEKKKVEMQKTVQNDAFYYIQRCIEEEENKKIENLSDTDFLNLILQFNSNASLCIINWQWDKNCIKSSFPTYLLLKFSFNGIQEITISKFCYTVFSLFQKPQSIKKALNIFLNNYIDRDLIKEDKIKEKIILQTILQIKEGLHTGILTILSDK